MPTCRKPWPDPITLAGLIVFSAAYALAVASPGPGTAAVVAQVLGRGLPFAPAFILGMLTGDLIWFVTASLGLAALAQAYSGIFVFIKWAGIACLVFLARKMWSSNSNDSPSSLALPMPPSITRMRSGAAVRQPPVFPRQAATRA